MLWIEKVSSSQRATDFVPPTVVSGLAALIGGGARGCAPLTSLWFVRYHWPWFSVVRHRPAIRIVLVRLPPIEPVFLFYASCGHLMGG